MKVQFKFLLLLFGFFMVIIVAYSAVIYYSVSQFSYEDFYKRLEIRAITTAKINLDKNVENTSAIRELRQEYLEKLGNERHYIFSLDQHTDLQKQAASINVPVSFLEEIVAKKTANTKRGEVFFSGIRYSYGNTTSIVIVSAKNYYNSHHVLYLRGVIFASIVVVVLFTFLFSVLFSRLIFRPIIKMTRSVKSIGMENLHMRVEMKNEDDELGRLAMTFNNMLDRLETSFETQNNFISNASHELGTPLTSIIGVADVTLSKPRSQEEYIESLRVIAEEAEKLDRKTKALLFLAQTGFNGKVQQFTGLRIDQLLLDVKDTIRKIYPACRVIIDLELLPESPDKLKVSGNEQLLHLAFSNVIGNACKYSENAPVKVAIGTSDTNVVIVIKDEGIGIPKDEIRYIYDPFFRASNTRSYEGYGIGLPLTRNIIKIHGGELLVSAIENQGTTVQIKLPVGDFNI